MNVSGEGYTKFNYTMDDFVEQTFSNDSTPIVVFPVHKWTIILLLMLEMWMTKLHLLYNYLLHNIKEP